MEVVEAGEAVPIMDAVRHDRADRCRCTMLCGHCARHIGGRSSWIPGSSAPTLSEKCHAFFRPLPKKGFKEERVTSIRLNNLSTSTTLESNTSLVREAYRRSAPWTGGRHASSAEGIVCLSNRCQRWRREQWSRQPGACSRCPRALAAGRRCQPRRLRMRRRGRGRPGHRVSQGGKMRRALAVLVGGLRMLAGCVTLPVGPNVAVLPAPEKPQEVFVADDAACREYAAQQTGL